MLEFLGNLPDWAAVVVAYYGLRVANRHFNKQPDETINIFYDAVQEGKKQKQYRFWAVNDGNVSTTVRWAGLRKASNLSAVEDGYEYTIGDDVDWHLIEPGEATEPIYVDVLRITQIIKRAMDAGDTRYVDAAFFTAHNELVERKKIAITTTMARDNSKLPKAPNNGIVKYKHANEIGVSSQEDPNTGSPNTAK